MTVFDIAMEVLTEHRIGYDCSCGWQPTIGGILPDEQNEHRAAVFAERFGGLERALRDIAGGGIWDPQRYAREALTRITKETDVKGI